MRVARTRSGFRPIVTHQERIWCGGPDSEQTIVHDFFLSRMVGWQGGMGGGGVSLRQPFVEVVMFGNVSR